MRSSICTPSSHPNPFGGMFHCVAVASVSVSVCLVYQHLFNCMSRVLHGCQNGSTSEDGPEKEAFASLPPRELTTLESDGPKAEPLISPKELYKWLEKIEVFLFGFVAIYFDWLAAASLFIYRQYSNI